jgi:ABC-type uncharacterized transport system ATPase component
MQSIEINKGIKLGFEEFVNGASKMDTPTLTRFFKTLGNLLTVRATNAPDRREAEILEVLENLVPAVLSRRYRALHKKLQGETITEKERSELRNIANFIEEKATDRVYLLAELAALRQIPLEELIRQMRKDNYGTAKA